MQPSAKRFRPNPPSLNSGAAPGKRKSPRTDAQKIETILETIQAQNWTVGCFLYNIFRTKDIKGDEIKRSPMHLKMVSIFLAGRGKKTMANIILEWMSHPDGRISKYSPNSDLMYSTTTTGEKVADEAEGAVKISNGLHVSLGKQHPEAKRRENFGEATIPRVQAVIEKQQPVTLYLMGNVAMRKPRVREGIEILRKSRPAETVITHALASLNYCRTDHANLLPLMRGILYYGSSVPVELMNYNCRIGNMPAPATIWRALQGLSEEEARVTASFRHHDALRFISLSLTLVSLDPTPAFYDPLSAD